MDVGVDVGVDVGMDFAHGDMTCCCVVTVLQSLQPFRFSFLRAYVDAVIWHASRDLWQLGHQLYGTGEKHVVTGMPGPIGWGKSSRWAGTNPAPAVQVSPVSQLGDQ